MTTRLANDTALDGNADADWDSKTGGAINASATNAIDGASSYRYLGAGIGSLAETFGTNIGGRLGRLRVVGKLRIVTALSSDYCAFCAAGVFGAVVVPSRKIRAGFNYLTGVAGTDYTESAGTLTAGVTYDCEVEWSCSGLGNFNRIRVWINGALFVTHIQNTGTPTLDSMFIGTGASKATGEIIFDVMKFWYIPPTL